jgi:hypothetical protein
MVIRDYKAFIVGNVEGHESDNLIFFHYYPEHSTHVYPVTTLKAYSSRTYHSKAFFPTPREALYYKIFNAKKCYASFWDMWKGGAVNLPPILHAHIPGSHVQGPGLSLVARWTKYIPEGSTTQLKRVK